MQLSEQQIHRYSRQILVAEIGGVGQTRLLAGGVNLATGGAAVQAGAAYLAASGVAISAQGAVERGEEGFLLSTADIGIPRMSALQGTLRDLNPDAVGPRKAGCLAAMPAAFSGPGPWIAIGGSKKQGAILYRSDQGCEDCFRESAAVLREPPDGATSILLGTLSALVYQRLCLTLGSKLGGLWVDEAGRLHPMELRRCSRCI
jgi:molybdopterin-synthase adenylyltransferase